MHADDGQRRLHSGGRLGDKGVNPHLETLGQGHTYPLRPGRIDTQSLEPARLEWRGHGSHQMISATLAFRPDPIPMQRTRSPAAISD